MEKHERLQAIANELEKGIDPQPVSVRTLLSWFGAERRGSWIVWRIRRSLDEVGLRTDPDFEAVYIDSLVRFIAAGSLAEVSAVEAVSAATAVPGPQHPAYEDPTYRISKLASANQPVTSVAPDATLKEAVTLMLANDFSQLPLMTTDREVKGVVSWETIGSRLALGTPVGPVRQFMEPAPEIAATASLFAAIPIVVKHQYVLVRDQERRIAGIITSSDLSLQFEQLSAPFLFLAEIENHIRRILSGPLSKEELQAARDPTDAGRPIEVVSDLTFGGYVRLLENEVTWTKIGMSVDRVTFVKRLARVRDIRNDVMHFDPDGIPPEDLEALRDFAGFLQRLQDLGVC